MLLKELSEKINAKLVGDGNIDIVKVSNLVTAGSGEISFLSNKKYSNVLETTKASAVIVKESDLDKVKCSALVVDDPYLGYAKVAQILDSTPPIALSIHPTAVIEEGAVIGKNVGLGPFVYIAKNAVIHDDVQIGAHCVIGENTIIGQGTKIYPNVSIYHNVQIGQQCLIQSNTVIGSDGFGYANDKGKWEKIPQIGRVIIGNMVEIGACTCIDRGAIDDTIIEDNVIIDNLCQIAHNVKIGYGTAVAGATVFAGSVTIGKYCIIGGTSVFNGHITICDQVTISGMCMVMKSIKEPGVYSSGIPAQKNADWRLTATRVLHISDMYKTVKQLNKDVELIKNNLELK